MKNYNRRNCTGCIRGTFIDKYQRTITICGKHAFEYDIEIMTITKVTIIEHYQNGKMARKRFNELKKKR